MRTGVRSPLVKADPGDEAIEVNPELNSKLHGVGIVNRWRCLVWLNCSTQCTGRTDAAAVVNDHVTFASEAHCRRDP